MSPKPRMLQLCAVDFTVANLLLPLVQECQRDFDVEIACAPGNESSRLEAEGYRFRYIPFSRSMSPFAHLRAFVSLMKLFRSQRYDIIHTHTPIAAVLARFAAHLCGVPTVVNSVHGFYFHEHMRTPLRKVAESLERWAGRYTDYTFFQSEEDYQVALRLGICTPQTGLWIGNGVDQGRFNPGRTELKTLADTFRKELGLSPAVVTITIVARLVREKGIVELLEAFRLIANSCPEAHLVLVGDALESDRDEVGDLLERVLTDPTFGWRIHRIGYRRDVETVLKASDIFALPSYREGMPRSIIEAMSMALPVVASNIRGCREEVVEGETGFLVPHRSVTSLAEALRRLVVDADLRRRLGSAGLERARTLYSEHLVLQRQTAVFARLLKGGRGR